MDLVQPTKHLLLGREEPHVYQWGCARLYCCNQQLAHVRGLDQQRLTPGSQGPPVTGNRALSLLFWHHLGPQADGAPRRSTLLTVVQRQRKSWLFFDQVCLRRDSPLTSLASTARSGHLIPSNHKKIKGVQISYVPRRWGYSEIWWTLLMTVTWNTSRYYY